MRNREEAEKSKGYTRALHRNNGEGHCTAPRHCAMTSTTPVRNYEPAGYLQLCWHSARLFWNQHPRLDVSHFCRNVNNAVVNNRSTTQQALYKDGCMNIINSWEPMTDFRLLLEFYAGLRCLFHEWNISVSVSRTHSGVKLDKLFRLYVSHRSQQVRWLNYYY